MIYSCTDSLKENIDSDNLSELIVKFTEINSKIESANLDDFDMILLKSKLDNTKNYEQSIYNRILYNDKSVELDLVNISDNYTEFDELLSENLVKSFITDDIVTFFNKADQYQIFINSNISNISKLQFLTDAIEQYKWMKYTAIEKIITIQSNQNFQNKCGTCYPETACFDSCMENGIEDQFDSLTGWVQFIVAPGPSIGWVASECIEKCYFNNDDDDDDNKQ